MSGAGLISIFVTLTWVVLHGISESGSAAPRLSPIPVCSKLVSPEELVERVPNSFQALELDRAASPEAIANHFNTMANEGYLTEQQISDLIKSFGPGLRKPVIEILAVLSQWATPKSFGALEEGIVNSIPQTAPKSILWQASSGGSLSAAISYLISKSDRPSKPAGTIDVDGTSPQSGLRRAMLEPSLVRRMLTDPEYAALLNRGNTQFIYAEGFSEGINFLAYMHQAENIFQTVFRILKLMEANTSWSAQDAAYEVATGELRRRFPFLTDRIHRVSNLKKAPRDYSISDLAELHRPQQVSANDIQKAISTYEAQFTTEDVSEVLKLIQSSFLLGQVVSYPSLMRSVRTLMDRTVALADSHGIQKENIHIVVPSSQKSYAITAYMANALGIIPERNIVSAPASAIISADPIATVTLDDFAGTGSSLGSRIKTSNLISKQPALDLRISAVAYITDYAIERIQKQLGDFPTGRAFLLWDKKAKTDLKQRLVSTNASAKTAWNGILGTSYSETGTQIIFPYMSPDNNYRLFGTFVAPLFLPKAAAKSSSYVVAYARNAPNVPELRADFQEQLPTIRKVLEILKKASVDNPSELSQPTEMMTHSFKVGRTVYTVHRQLWETATYKYVSTYQGKEFWVPKDPKGQILISLEEQLREQLSRVADIAKAVGPDENTYLPHVISGPKLFPSKTLAAHLEKGQITDQQITALSDLWHAARNLASRTGISLDLDSRNLVWSQSFQSWQLIRVLPSLIKNPFCFTLDSKSFSDFISYTIAPEDCSKLRNPMTSKFVMDWIELERTSR